jgi:rubrerythrin
VNELLGIVILVLLLGGFSVLTGGGRSATELRMRRRWESSFESDIRRVRPTDATGVLMCRRCGTSGSERAGRCPSCGAIL